MKGPKPLYRKQTKSWYVQIGKKQHTLGKNKKEAWAKYHALKADRQDVEDDTTVAQLIDRYLEWCKNHRAKRTYDWYAWHLSSLLDSVGCRLKVRDIKPYHATRWLDERYKGTSDTYRCGAVRSLKRAFNWAVKEGYLVRSPVANVSRPVQRSRIAYLTPDQWQELVKAVEEREDRDFLEVITVMRLTGCRPQGAPRRGAGGGGPGWWGRKWGMRSATMRSRPCARSTAAATTARRARGHWPGGCRSGAST